MQARTLLFRNGLGGVCVSVSELPAVEEVVERERRSRFTKKLVKYAARIEFLAKFLKAFPQSSDRM